MGKEKRVRVQCPACGMEGRATQEALEKELTCPKCGARVQFVRLMTEDELFFEGMSKAGRLVKKAAKFGARRFSERRHRYAARKKLLPRLREHFGSEQVSKEVIEDIRRAYEPQGLDLRQEVLPLKAQFDKFMCREARRVVAMGRLEPGQKAAFKEYLDVFGADEWLVYEVRRSVQVAEEIQTLESGNAKPLEQVEGLVVRNSEIVWQVTPALLVNRSRSGEETEHDGSLYVTNMRLVFTSRTAPQENDISKVNAVETEGGALYVLSKTQQASSEFRLDQPELAAAYIRHAVRVYHRQVDVGFEGLSRQIPQEVKQAVWQRDGGRCVECGATDYLEFDHIIPFSKGGDSTVDNIQLLCRRCNLKKSDRL